MSVAEAEVIICNQKGLHARAAAAFVKCIAEVDAEVTVEKDGIEVDGSSILSLMMLGASKGCSVKIRAEGDDAKKAIDDLVLLINNRFGEES